MPYILPLTFGRIYGILLLEVMDLKNDTQIVVFCQNIKKLREKNGLSEKEMAKILGIGAISLEKIEQGIIPYRTGVKLIFNISQHFGIEPHKLFMHLQ